MDSRVVLTFPETAPIGCLKIAFKSEVLPALGAPIKATRSRLGSVGCEMGEVDGAKTFALVGTGDRMYEDEVKDGRDDGEKY